MNRKLKYYIIFGKKFYPALARYQAGLHMVMVPLIIWGVIEYISKQLCSWTILICCLVEVLAFLICFDESEAKNVEKNGWPPLEDDI